MNEFLVDVDGEGTVQAQVHPERLVTFAAVGKNIMSEFGCRFLFQIMLLMGGKHHQWESSSDTALRGK